MTILFQDGFESGDFSKWTSTESVGAGSTETVETNNPFQGKYNGKFSTSSAGAEATVYKTIASAAIVYLRFYAKLDVLPDNGTHFYFGSIADAVPSAGTGTAVAILNTGGQFFWVLFDDGFGETSEAVASNPSAGVYYSIELLRDRTNGIERLYVDGVLKVTRNDALTTDATNIAVGTDFNDNGKASNIYHDSVIASTTLIGPAVTSAAFTENLITRDSIQRNVKYKRLETETLTIRDTFNRRIRYLRKLTEPLIFQDTFNRGKASYNRLQKETIILTDKLTRKFVGLRSSIENLKFQDTFTRLTSYKRKQVEQPIVSESPSLRKRFSRFFSENLQLKDSQTRSATYNRNLVEQPIVSEIPSFRKNFSRFFSENVILQESFSYVYKAAHVIQHYFYTFVEDLSSIGDSLNRMVTIQDLIDELNNFAAAAKAALTELENQIKKKYAKFKLRRT